MSEKKEIRFSLTTFLLILLIIGIISGLTTAIVMTIFTDNTKNEQVAVVNETKNEVVEEKEEVKENIELDGKVFSMDFNFLKLNNKEENVIYSPLSIRYALKMLEDGSNGTTKEQINKLVTDRALTKYESNSNLSLANVLFVKDTFKDNIKSTYSSLLKTNYNAEVITDSFASSENVNKYVSDKTLGLLQNLLPEGPIAYEYLLINALGIDLDWEEKFIEIDGYHVDYSHTDFGWYTAENVLKFNNFANNAFVLFASEPPFKIPQLPDLINKDAICMKQSGLASKITPITPIGVAIFFKIKSSSNSFCHKILLTGSSSLTKSFKPVIKSLILFSLIFNLLKVA